MLVFSSLWTSPSHQGWIQGLGKPGVRREEQEPWCPSGLLSLLSAHAAGSGAACNPTLPFLSCFTWLGMWLYFVLPTFAFPKGGNERASVPPIYCAS